MINVAEKSNPPLHRHESLRPLSRDHYLGLMQSQRLMSVGRSEAAKPFVLLQDYLEKWEQELCPHFADEEHLLPPLIVSSCDRQRLFAEHDLIRDMTARLAEEVGRGSYNASAVEGLGQLLHDHIRWEERVLFEAIQASAARHQLAELAEATDRIEHSRDRRSCRDRQSHRPA